MSNQRVLVAGDLSPDETEALESNMPPATDVTVIQNEERGTRVLAAFDPHLIHEAWQAVPFVAETGATATGLVELINVLRKRRGPSAPIEVVKPPAIYVLPVDISTSAVAGLRDESGKPFYSYEDDLKRALQAIDAEQPARDA